jgi:hypothetical protein
LPLPLLFHAITFLVFSSHLLSAHSKPPPTRICSIVTRCAPPPLKASPLRQQAPTTLNPPRTPRNFAASSSLSFSWLLALRIGAGTDALLSVRRLERAIGLSSLESTILQSRRSTPIESHLAKKGSGHWGGLFPCSQNGSATSKSHRGAFPFRTALVEWRHDSWQNVWKVK